MLCSWDRKPQHRLKEGCVDPRAHFNASEKKKSRTPAGNWNKTPRTSSPWPSNCTDQAVPAGLVQLRRENYLLFSNWSLGTTEIPIYSRSCDKQTIYSFNRWLETSTETAGTIQMGNVQHATELLSRTFPCEWPSWSTHCTASRKVAWSNADGMIEIFHWQFLRLRYGPGVGL